MTITRRTFVQTGLGLAATGLTLPAGLALAQDKSELVLGATLPLSGVFAPSAAALNNGLQDYVKIINEQGGIDGRQIRYDVEDTGYKVDVAVSVFNKITARGTVNFFFGDSTGFAKVIAKDAARKGTILMSGNSFASELNDPASFPLYFMAGPDYSEQVFVLLRHIAQEKPGAKVAFVYSDSEFGRDPIAPSVAYAATLNLEIVSQIATPLGTVDVSTSVLKLRRATPDYTIFHGFTLAPIPDFITQAKGLGMETKFMGTYWAMDWSTVKQMGADANGFLGVVPYRYFFDEDSAAPLLAKARQLRTEYQQLAYVQGLLTAMLFFESAKRAIAAGKELTAANLKAALNSIENFDTGGLVGTPISVKGNSIPIARVYRYDAAKDTMVASSDWIDLSK